jgi:hypothetical protein
LQAESLATFLYKTHKGVAEQAEQLSFVGHGFLRMRLEMKSGKV